MKISILVIGITFLPLIATAELIPVVPGDYLFIHAREIGCDEKAQLVEFGQVQESGEVLLFGDILLDVKGKVTDQIKTQLIDAWEEKHSYRPTTVRIERNPKADAKERTFMLMELYEERKHKCQRPRYIENSPDWRLAQDYSLNKPLKHAPAGLDALRARA